MKRTLSNNFDPSGIRPARILLLFLLGACACLQYTNAQTVTQYFTSGTTTWTVPGCVNSVTVQVWGGGGGGGAVWSRYSVLAGAGDCESGDEICVCGGGGGGGGFATRTYSVVPGQIYNITVGAGGNAGATSGPGYSTCSTGPATSGGTGGTSTFSGPATSGTGTLGASGGSGGNPANMQQSCLGGCSFNHIGCNGTGGGGGIGSNGSSNFSGGNGAAGVHSASTNDKSGGGGGAAGPTGNGASGGVSPATSITGGGAGNAPGGNGANGNVQPYGTGYLGTTGSAGNTIGGGGSGASSHHEESCTSTSARSRVGGAGARGEVRITYTDCILPAELSLFDAEYQDPWNLVTWTASADQAVSYYVLQRSNDLDAWEDITFAEGYEGASDFTFYNHQDHNFKENAFNYYRLTTVDASGDYEVISKVVMVDNKFPGSKRILRAANMLGHEVAPDTKGVVLLIYEDGSTRKIFNQ